MHTRRYAPAAERNRAPILHVLRRHVPEGARVLEVASGTGQQVAFFAASLPRTSWLPSEADPSAFGSIAAWAGFEGASNVGEALLLDAAAENWPVGILDAVYCANLIHIAPWTCCIGLLRGAGIIDPCLDAMMDRVHAAAGGTPQEGDPSGTA